jgi:hypothetical protein
VKTSSDRDALERAAVALARSSDPQDRAVLGQSLRDTAFLARLDDPKDRPTRHLGAVMTALGEHGSPQTEELCLALLNLPPFQLFDRKGLVLKALAGVRPMSAQAATAFERANGEGFFAFASPLLAANGSPRAIGLLQSMMLDRSVPVARRVDCLHLAIVPRRTDLAILQVADRILSQALERQLIAGVTESVFDYQPLWFGLGASVPKPPDWESGSVESLRLAVRIADKALARSDIGVALREAVRQSRATIANTLAARSK